KPSTTSGSKHTRQAQPFQVNTKPGQSPFQKTRCNFQSALQPEFFRRRKSALVATAFYQRGVVFSDR
ncbi:hypothetical protein QMO56_23070, partial [Roseomonas sp. E05]|uniref:hypothetical protein n=1 Tax=Roseomonas sp. E05 TaxID=3046310 RepID=UPI0024B9FC0C